MYDTYDFKALLQSLLERPEGLVPKPQAITLFRGKSSKVESEINYGYEFLAGKYIFQNGNVHIFNQDFFDSIESSQQILLDFALVKAIGYWVAKSRSEDRSRDVLGQYQQYSINISNSIAEFPFFLKYYLNALKESFNIVHWPKVVLEVNEHTTVHQIENMKRVLGNEIDHLNFALDDISPANFHAIFTLSRLRDHIQWCKIDYMFFHKAYDDEPGLHQAYLDLVNIVDILSRGGNLGGRQVKIIFEGVEHNAHRQFIGRLMERFSLKEVFLQGVGVVFR